MPVSVWNEQLSHVQKQSLAQWLCLGRIRTWVPGIFAKAHLAYAYMLCLLLAALGLPKIDTSYEHSGLKPTVQTFILHMSSRPYTDNWLLTCEVWLFLLWSCVRFVLCFVVRVCNIHID